MYFTLNYEVARTIQQDRLRKAAEAQGAIRRSRDELDRGTVGVGIAGQPATPGLGGGLAQTPNPRHLKPVLDLIEVPDGKGDKDPQRVAS